MDQLNLHYFELYIAIRQNILHYAVCSLGSIARELDVVCK